MGRCPEGAEGLFREAEQRAMNQSFAVLPLLHEGSQLARCPSLRENHFAGLTARCPSLHENRFAGLTARYPSLHENRFALSRNKTAIQCAFTALM